MRTRVVSVLAVALTSSVLVVPQLAHAASPPAVGSPTTSVSESADYASEVFSDPWDMSNAYDVAGPNGIAGGIETYVPSTSNQPTLVPYTVSTQPWGRDGRISPVNTARYTKLSVRMWTSVDAYVGVSWTKCSWAVTSCRGYLQQPTTAGWHTYDLTMVGSGLSTAPASWSGQVIGLRLTGKTGTTVKVDWARLHAPSATVADVPWTDPSPGRTATVYWDGDADTSNNSASNPNWGAIETVTSAASQTTHFAIGAYPPGAYRYYVVAGGDTSALSGPTTVIGRPRPFVTKPAPVNGADYATVVRHDPWDMAQRSDYLLTNASFLGSNGQWFAAQNTSNDPRVSLAVPTGFPGSAYHRLQIRVALIGSFGLANVPGGGCVGRLLWTTASGGVTKWQTSDDIVLYPGWNNVSIDLATSPSSAIVDPSAPNRIGWAGQTITRVRFDPNEDPGKRQWDLDDIKITMDPASSKGMYDVQFSDTTGQGATTATVEAISPTGAVVTVVTGRAVTAGNNIVVWKPPTSVPAGTYRIRVTLTNSAGSLAHYASAPIRMVPTA